MVFVLPSCHLRDRFLEFAQSVTAHLSSFTLHNVVAGLSASVLSILEGLFSKSTIHTYDRQGLHTLGLIEFQDGLKLGADVESSSPRSCSLVFPSVSGQPWRKLARGCCVHLALKI